jgi:hypothetical protein
MNQENSADSSAPIGCSAADGPQLTVNPARSADDIDICGTCRAEMLLLHPLTGRTAWCPQCGTISTPYRRFVPRDRKIDPASVHDGH